MSDRIRELLASVELFGEMIEEEIDDLTALAQVKKLPKDTTVFHAGDPADAVFVVASGRVKVVITSSDGKEFILTVLGAGQVFGEMALLESAPRSASVVTLSAVEVLVINRVDFQRLLESNPRISLKLMDGSPDTFSISPATTANASVTAGWSSDVRPTRISLIPSAPAAKRSLASSMSSRRASDS